MPGKVTLAVAAAFGVLLLVACGDDGGTAADPTSVLEALEDAWNAEDVDAAVALFAEDGMETNGAGTFEGREAIRGIYVRALGVFDEMDCSNYQVAGNSVTYDCVLDRVTGERQGETYEAIVVDGEIRSNILIGTFQP